MEMKWEFLTHLTVGILLPSAEEVTSHVGGLMEKEERELLKGERSERWPLVEMALKPGRVLTRL